MIQKIIAMGVENCVFIIWLIISGYALAGFIMMLNFQIQQGNIFERYGKWLNKNEHKKITKVLGLCPFCYGFWISFITYIVQAILIPSTIPIGWLIFGLFLYCGYVYERIHEVMNKI